MIQFVKGTVRRMAQRFGFDIVRFPPVSDKPVSFLPDLSHADMELYRAVSTYTMTSPERIHALVQAAQYVVRCNIDGDIVECGVFKGGSMLALAKTLVQMGHLGKHLYLFDTFEGMTEPTDKDIAYDGEQATAVYDDQQRPGGGSLWAYSPIEEVQKIMYSSGYDRARIHFIKGRVEETIPKGAPDIISLLRLDTDWYESTRHELIHLFPRLVKGGVIIIDDYGHWRGSRQATDEYFRDTNAKLLLNRIDYSGRIGVKLV